MTILVICFVVWFEIQFILGCWLYKIDLDMNQNFKSTIHPSLIFWIKEWLICKFMVLFWCISDLYCSQWHGSRQWRHHRFKWSWCWDSWSRYSDGLHNYITSHASCLCCWRKKSCTGDCTNLLLFFAPQALYFLNTPDVSWALLSTTGTSLLYCRSVLLGRCLQGVIYLDISFQDALIFAGWDVSKFRRIFQRL